jgi:nucleoside triphosphate pyrophosphatase
MIYLASRSPRRRVLLNQLGVSFRVLDPDIDESTLAGETPDALVRRLAAAKAAAGRGLLGDSGAHLVLGADTVVVLDDEVLGKPRDAGHACELLLRLSGCWHRVLSGVALASADGTATRLSESRVCFRQLSRRECEAYAGSGEPLDKAGGYGIQGRAAAFVSNLRGSYSGVVGLPLYETAELLTEAGIALFPYKRSFNA